MEIQKHVLIIERDPLVRNLINNLLTTKNYVCDQVANRGEATQMLAHRDYDLILLDLMLDEDHGFRLLEHLAEHFPEMADYTILMTESDKRFLARLPQQGWCGVLIKPFSLAEFFRVVDLCIRGTHAGDELCQ